MPPQRTFIPPQAFFLALQPALPHHHKPCQIHLGQGLGKLSVLSLQPGQAAVSEGGEVPFSCRSSPTGLLPENLGPLNSEEEKPGKEPQSTCDQR